MARAVGVEKRLYGSEGRGEGNLTSLPDQIRSLNCKGVRVGNAMNVGNRSSYRQ